MWIAKWMTDRTRDVRRISGRAMKTNRRTAAIVAVLTISCVTLSAAGLSFLSIDLGTLGGATSFPLAANSGGVVVGYSEPQGVSTTHAFRWSQATGMRDLGTLGGDFGVATGVNSGGLIVGSSTLMNGAQHAFTWTPRSGLT